MPTVYFPDDQEVFIWLWRVLLERLGLDCVSRGGVGKYNHPGGFRLVFGVVKIYLSPAYERG